VKLERIDLRQNICLSFDVECYYQIVKKDYLGQYVEPTEEVLQNTTWILDELKSRGLQATFYFLGNVAEKFPELVQRTVSDGHEIGVHGDQHEYIHTLSRSQFQAEIHSALCKIRKAGASSIIGHRAPAFSIGRENYWAFEVLRDAGLQYDSSIMPLDGKRYGVAGWPRYPSLTEQGIFEIPMSVVDIFGKTVPCMGGGYVRYFPFAYTRYCASRLVASGQTPICYFHPYEFESDPISFTAEELSSVDESKLKRLRRMNFMQSYGRGKSMRRKLISLLENYKIRTVQSMRDTFSL
jgi:polysaccharide deacetylase family protein (PEP-CTERM system associated)